MSRPLEETPAEPAEEAPVETSEAPRAQAGVEVFGHGAEAREEA